MEVEVELSCSHCSAETLHQATIRNGRMELLACTVCGSVTRLPGYSTRRPASPVPREIARHGFSFGGRAKPAVQLGTGPVLVEGNLLLTAQPPGWVIPSLEAVHLALRLKEADCHTLRLFVADPRQLQLVSPIQVATGLPLAVDIGSRRDLLAQVLAVKPEAIILTLNPTEPLPAFGHLGSTALFVRLDVGEATVDEGADLAEQVARRLLGQGVQKLALSLACQDLTRYVDLHRAVQGRIVLPLRLELTAAHYAQNPAHLQLTLGSLLAESIGAIVAPVGAKEPVAAADDINRLLQVLGFLVLPYGRDRARAFRYYTKKTFDRVVSKPLRVVRELESNPRLYIQSLPGRVLTKPVRLVEEFRRIAGRIT